MIVNQEVQSWTTQVDGAGRMRLPAESRKVLGLDEKADVVVESDGDSLRILSLDRYREENEVLGEPLSACPVKRFGIGH